MPSKSSSHSPPISPLPRQILRANLSLGQRNRTGPPVVCTVTSGSSAILVEQIVAPQWTQRPPPMHRLVCLRVHRSHRQHTSSSSDSTSSSISALPIVAPPSSRLAEEPRPPGQVALAVDPEGVV